MTNTPFKLGKQITTEAHKKKLDRYRALSTPVKTEILIAIGYWHSVWEPEFPDPAWFQDREWKDRVAVIEHLRKGKSIADWMGYSWCRFRCNHIDMGCSDLTDGYYIYPEGLVHYIESHIVRLPDKFVEHIKNCKPRGINFEFKHCHIDYSWWKSQTGWNKSSSFLAPTDEMIKNHLRRIEKE